MPKQPWPGAAETRGGFGERSSLSPQPECQLHNSSKVYLFGTGRYGHGRKTDSDLIISEQAGKSNRIGDGTPKFQLQCCHWYLGQNSQFLWTLASSPVTFRLGNKFSLLQSPFRDSKCPFKTVGYCSILLFVDAHLFLICPFSPCRLSNYCEYVCVCVPL